MFRNRLFSACLARSIISVYWTRSKSEIDVFYRLIYTRFGTWEDKIFHAYCKYTLLRIVSTLVLCLLTLHLDWLFDSCVALHQA